MYQIQMKLKLVCRKIEKFGIVFDIEPCEHLTEKYGKD